MQEQAVGVQSGEDKVQKGMLSCVYKYLTGERRHSQTLLGKIIQSKDKKQWESTETQEMQI